MKRKLLFVCLAACLVASLPAQAPATATATAAPVKVAFLAVNNLGGDAQTEYLGGAIQGLLLFDLTRSPGVTLLDRNSLDRVLREQELQLSGLMDDAEGSRRFGQLLGADFLAWAEFVGLESEVMLTLRVVNVASGQSAAFRERGGDENAVHRAAESLALFLTGSRPNFAGASGERSIVRQLELAPGSLALHSILVRGEIYLDGEFAGYTTGSSEIPFIVDALPAGRHSLRVHLGSGFGVVTMPELSFGDWQTEFEVPSGGRVVLRDPTRDFNSQLLRLQVLLEETIVWSEANSGRFAQARELN
ncbi:MAG TPA: hypothetical protein DCX65_12925, partial [Spirochaetaceae bacterium]|nr:hypothetical protein [Spirochaetaceae bacterium]